MFDIIVFVLFIVIALGGVASIFFNSTNGLAYIQLLITFVGLLISLKEARPKFLGSVIINVKTLRSISVILLILIIALQSAILVPAIRHFCCSTPTPTVTLTPTPMPNPIPTNFNVTVIKLNNGQVLQEGQPIPVSRSPLTIDGTYSTKGSRQVWVVVQDTYGKYYLQNPPVKFKDSGQWTASNIITAVGVIKINFVCVTSQGNSTFQQAVADGSFGGFTLLPEGYQILKDIPIRVIKS